MISNESASFLWIGVGSQRLGRAAAAAPAAVVLVRGWALNSDMWRYQMIDLAVAGVRSIAYDKRGHERSADPGAGFDYDTLAAIWRGFSSS